MNLTIRGITAKVALPLAVLAVATVLSAPIKPPRVYTGGAGSAAPAHVNNMPSDPPVIRD